MTRGGCYCGRVRYEADSVFDAVYCHCSICRRISGAPVYAGIVIPKSEFRVVSGEPTSFPSSEHGLTCRAFPTARCRIRRSALMRGEADD